MRTPLGACVRRLAASATHIADHTGPWWRIVAALALLSCWTSAPVPTSLSTTPEKTLDSARAPLPPAARPGGVEVQGRSQRVSGDDVPAGLTAADWSHIRSALEASSYHASQVARPGEAPALVAANREQRYRTTFRREGIEIASRPVPGKDWRLGVRVTGFGPEGDVRPLPAAEPVAEKERVEYRRGPVTEWYENGPGGLEQGFTITETPAEGEGGALAIELALDGGLKAAARATPRFLPTPPAGLSSATPACGPGTRRGKGWHPGWRRQMVDCGWWSRRSLRTSR